MPRINSLKLAAASLFCFAAVILPGRPTLAGMVTLSFDDGLSSVYEDAFPVLKKHDIRATVGIVLDRVTAGKTADYMTAKQVLELQRNGWEVASHGLTHKRPIDIPEYLSNERIEGWELKDDTPCQCVYEAKYDYPSIAGLFEGEKRLKELGSMEDVSKTPGSYYFDTLAGSVHLHPFESGNPKDLKIHSSSYQREMRDSRKGLEALGFEVSTYVAPYNYWTAETRELSKYYYDQAADGGEAPNFRDSFERHWLKRYFVHTMGPAEEVIKRLKKEVVDKDGWVILCFHGIEDETGWQPWSAENLEQLASWLQEENIKVVTIAEGAAIMSEDK
jgi:peptidoglycan/xylan/chitin deacetylase (PgdA/CDA1 family)